ncbi:MAG: exonuclease domain-containing protein [Candidatus Omnitrophica bacterium]|nr:exonuclease domain-containing protein [Candidatus Omnitrophota bacterium]MCM8802178.1 exonuclease domain-containing protein [Candidatus Omnitrophota bacterium]
MKIKIDEIIVLDVETTGLNPEIDRICEISLLKFKNSNLIENFTTFINPESKIPSNISKLTGIRDIDVENAPKFEQVAEKIYDFINGKILLCHNASFDISFLKKEFERTKKYNLPEIKIIDTYLIAKKFFNFKKNSLHAISEFYKIEGTEHRAEDDAKKTFEIFKIFCRELGKIYRSISLNSLFLFRYQKNFFLKRIIFDINQIENKIYLKKVILEKIEKALNEKREILIKYMNMKKEITERKILPIEIINENGVKYLIGFCQLKKEERKFRIDRIEKII